MPANLGSCGGQSCPFNLCRFKQTDNNPTMHKCLNKKSKAIQGMYVAAHSKKKRKPGESKSFSHPVSFNSECSLSLQICTCLQVTQGGSWQRTLKCHHDKLLISLASAPSRPLQLDPAKNFPRGCDLDIQERHSHHGASEQERKLIFIRLIKNIDRQFNTHNG